MDKSTKQENPTEYKPAVKFIHTPKCKDCTPSPSMLKRRSCAGCTKIMYKNVTRRRYRGLGQRTILQLF